MPKYLETWDELEASSLMMLRSLAPQLFATEGENEIEEGLKRPFAECPSVAIRIDDKGRRGSLPAHVEESGNNRPIGPRTFPQQGRGE